MNAAIIGSRGSGISAVTQLLLHSLKVRNIAAVLLDCRSPGTWQDNLRDICQTLVDSQTVDSSSIILVIDHASDLATDHIPAIRAAASQWQMARRRSVSVLSSSENPDCAGSGGVLRFGAEVWVGMLDCRTLKDKVEISLTSEPKYVFQLPEYTPEHLLALYSIIGQRQNSQWSEAILYTILDWCGPDLALAESLSERFYGNWRDNEIYDDTVSDNIAQWLESDPLIEDYRKCIAKLDGPGKDFIRLLNSGGKVPSHSPTCNQDPDESIRRLFLGGIVSANLLPGYYQYRNLAVRLLALQSDPDSCRIEAIDLLRKHSNGRIGDILQDAELSLRLLALRCFNRMGSDAVRDKLMATRTDEQAIPAELRKSLQDWAKETGGPENQKALGQHLSQYQREFDSSRNLWTKIIGLYANELGDVMELAGDPPLAKTISYMTLSEVSNLIVSLEKLAFPQWTGKEPGKDPPWKRWPSYMALMRRMRNQSAHLRNVAFQDTEDLLTALREMRKDINKYG